MCKKVYALTGTPFTLRKGDREVPVPSEAVICVTLVEGDCYLQYQEEIYPVFFTVSQFLEFLEGILILGKTKEEAIETLRMVLEGR